MNTTGQFIPPLFIFRRAPINQRLWSNGHAEDVDVAQSNGQMNSDISVSLKEM
jgi:hypothetical protein